MRTDLPEPDADARAHRRAAGCADPQRDRRRRRRASTSPATWNWRCTRRACGHYSGARRVRRGRRLSSPRRSSASRSRVAWRGRSRSALRETARATSSNSAPAASALALNLLLELERSTCCPAATGLLERSARPARTPARRICCSVVHIWKIDSNGSDAPPAQPWRGVSSPTKSSMHYRCDLRLARRGPLCARAVGVDAAGCLAWRECRPMPCWSAMWRWRLAHACRRCRGLIYPEVRADAEAVVGRRSRKHWSRVRCGSPS